MDKDLENSIVLFGKKYNDEIRETTIRSCHYPMLIDLLDKTFSSSDVLAKSKTAGVKTTVKMIISRWVKDKIVKKVAEDKWSKVD